MNAVLVFLAFFLKKRTKYVIPFFDGKRERERERDTVCRRSVRMQTKKIQRNTQAMFDNANKGGKKKEICKIKTGWIDK